MKYSAILLLLLSSIAYGQQNYPLDVTLCWTNPTEYTDNSLIQDGDIASVRITGARHDGTALPDQSVVSDAPGLRQCATFTGVIPQPGTYSFFAYAITVDSISSDASNQADKKYTGKPKPITVLTVN